MIQLLKSSNISKQLVIFCSHSRNRPELALSADFYVQQPAISKSAEWLLEQCIEHNIQLLFCGKHSHHIEPFRAQFEQHGIQLITGTLSTEQHELMNNKYQFTLHCQAQNLPVIPALLANSTETLKTSIETLQLRHNEICAKPVYGVYGAGFVRLQNHVSYFKNFSSPTKCNTQQFIEAYSQQEKPVEYLIMPYLAGQECSVDIACSQGNIIAQVTRIKHVYFQACFLQHPCHQICIDLVDYFQCDGLINIQFKQDESLQWHILEINPRPAGGFAYTQHTGVNLIAELIAEKLNLNLVRAPQQSPIKALPIAHSIKLDL
ncbi:ATP-grasp domain-containing protein [Acinetobacter bereziniae]|uniref:ATP-grasp domain-containing protein n=1 Tax=Acinetobacter bereziniae TaxID=106648 RepID=UPI001D0EAE53|nr:ATP-grasp domain-containing protein [Acinetobacter bereziniae]